MSSLPPPALIGALVFTRNTCSALLICSQEPLYTPRAGGTNVYHKKEFNIFQWKYFMGMVFKKHALKLLVKGNDWWTKVYQTCTNSYDAINHGDSNICLSDKIVYWEDTFQNSVLSPQQANDPLDMDPDIGDPSGLLHIKGTQLILPSCKCWNYQLCLLKHNTLLYCKATVSHDHITRQ